MDLAVGELPLNVSPATREEGLRRLDEFAPRAGAGYAKRRNFDYGPDRRSNVSTLSPWIRHRLVLESEVIEAVLEHHPIQEANKFVQEICWRTYWKGWLEMRPAVWKDYRSAVARFFENMASGTDLAERWQSAATGTTGIECFDAWTAELRETGYLHNHARMWFASIWIFTLRLPWELGADFFLRHLLDGDPASNTLSWLWVAGLQTRGKTYLARPGNIQRYTAGRFRPGSELSAAAKPVSAAAPPAPRELPLMQRMDLDQAFGLVITEDDLHPESLGLPDSGIQGIIGLTSVQRRSPWSVSAVVTDFTRRALDDALRRAGSAFGAEAEEIPADFDPEELTEWASSLGVKQLVTAYVPAGPARERLRETRKGLDAAGIRLIELRRAWDDRLWPHATKGYFQFKSRTLPALEDLGIVSG